MDEGTSAERRQHTRFPLATSVEFYHTASKRDFPGRSVDVSDGGMLMYVPATVPVHPGQVVRLNARSIHPGKVQRNGDGKVHAKIVRVDRQPLLTTGHIAVGMKFDAPPC
jgi:c-di-GMP-binding flagellar brake protein YcgR